MSDKQFNGFDNSLAPTAADSLVGFGTVAGVTKEKRWLVSAWKTFWQGVLNITLLDREKANYVSVTGGAGNPVIAAVGSSANISLNLTPKGSGLIYTNGILWLNDDLHCNGNTLDTDGGGIVMGGAELNTENGNVTVGTGTLSVVGGTVTLNSVTLGSTASTWNLTTTDINLNSGDFTITGGHLYLSATGFSFDSATLNAAAFFTFNGDMLIIGDLTIDDLNADNIVGTKAVIPFADIYNLGVTNPVQFNDGVIFDDIAYHNTDVVCDTYLRGGATFGQTADVTSVQGGGLISVEVNEYSTVANVGDCATLPALNSPNAGGGARSVYTKIIIINNGANSMDVFPNTSGVINGGAADAAIAVANGAQVTLYGQSVGGVDTWFSVD